MLVLCQLARLLKPRLGRDNSCLSEHAQPRSGEASYHTTRKETHSPWVPHLMLTALLLVWSRGGSMDALACLSSWTEGLVDSPGLKKACVKSHPTHSERVQSEAMATSQVRDRLAPCAPPTSRRNEAPQHRRLHRLGQPWNEVRHLIWLVYWERSDLYFLHNLNDSLIARQNNRPLARNPHCYTHRECSTEEANDAHYIGRQKYRIQQ
jgi:hypothetical protein